MGEGIEDDKKKLRKERINEIKILKRRRRKIRKEDYGK